MKRNIIQKDSACHLSTENMERENHSFDAVRFTFLSQIQGGKEDGLQTAFVMSNYTVQVSCEILSLFCHCLDVSSKY